MSEKQPENQYERMKKTFLGLLIILAFIAVLLAISQLDGLYRFLQIVFSVIGLPLIMALLLYYLSTPIVNLIENRGVSRKTAVIIFFVIAVLVIVIFILILSPIIYEQGSRLFSNIPYYFEEIRLFFESFIVSDQFSQISDYLAEFNIMETLRNQWENILSATIGGINNVIAAVVQIVLVIFTTPFILYYMLVGNGEGRESLLNILPTKFRKTISQMLIEINTQLSSYIRGQLLVAIGVGVMLATLFAIIGLDYALVLGIIAGILNMIPYFGSFVGFILALIVAMVDSPFMVVKTIIAFGIEQLIEGRILSPLVLGANLKIHPITVLFVLLLGARFLGILGAFISIPIYAIVRIVGRYIIDWFKASRPDLYPDEQNLAVKRTEEKNLSEE